MDLRGLAEVGNEVEFDVAAFCDGVVEFEEGGEFCEELGIAGFEVGFIEKFNGGGDDVESLFAGFCFGLGEVGGDSGEVARGGGDEFFRLVEDFGLSGGGFCVDFWRGVESVLEAGEENLGAGEDGREEGAGLLGQEDEMTKVFRFFKSLEEGVLGGFVHGVGRGDDEKAIFRLAVVRQSEKLANLFDGNDASDFRLVRIEIEGVFRGWQRVIESCWQGFCFCAGLWLGDGFEFCVGRDNENRAAGFAGDFGNVGEAVEKHYASTILMNSSGRGAVKVLRMPLMTPVTGSFSVPGMVISSSRAWRRRRVFGLGSSP